MHVCRHICFPAVTKEKRIVFSPNSVKLNDSESAGLGVCACVCVCVVSVCDVLILTDHVQNTRPQTNTGLASGSY